MTSSTSSRLRPAALFVAVVAAGVMRAPSAGAATVAPTAGAIVSHNLPNGQSFTRDPTLNPGGINYEDCERDVQFTFPITVSDVTMGTDQLFVYAGTNCGDPNQRTGLAGTTCWQVYDGPYPYVADTNLPITIPVRQILSQQFSGVSASFVSVTGESICHQQAVSAAQTLNVYFIVTDSTGTVTEAVATAGINADLSASIEPPNFTLEIGDTQLFPKWTKVNDPDITGFNVYYLAQAASVQAKLMTVCPDGGMSTGGDAGATEAGSDAGGGADAADAGDADDADDAGDAGATQMIVPNDVDGDGSTDAASDASDASDEAGVSGVTGVTSDGGTPTGCFPEAVIDPTPQADGNAQPFMETGFSCLSPFPPNDTQPVGADDTTTSTTSDDVDGGTDGGTTTVTSSGGSIGPMVFQPQEFDPTTFQLVTVSSGSSSATLSGLIDNHSYAVAVAAVDAFGNVGALTSATGLALCQYPLGTTDFWSQYQTDGGENTGCNLGDPQLPGGAGVTSLIAGAACVAVLRRRKKSSSI